MLLFNASSNAPGVVMSGTTANSSCDVDASGKMALTSSTLDCERTTARIEFLVGEARRRERMCEAM